MEYDIVVRGLLYVKFFSPRVCLFDHVYQPQELLDPDAGLAATELAGQLGDVFLGEGVTLKQEEIIMKYVSECVTV